jgi:glycosyltransferase involved in cell wall biosynthesis
VLIGVNQGDLTDDLSNVTGVGKYTRELVKYLGEIRDDLELEVKVVYDFTSAVSAIKGIIKGTFADFSSYDIVHFAAPKPFAPLRKKIVITTVHDLFFLRYRESGHPLLKRFYVQNIVHSDAVLTVSSLIEEDLWKTVNYRGKSFVVNLGIDEKFFRPPKTPERNDKVRLKLGFVGRVDHERKNLARGIRTFKELKDENVVFEIWGGYDPRSEVFKRVQREAEGDTRVRFMGPAPEERIVEIYDSFDALFLPSIEEGFGLPILEANARGVPVIVYEDARIPKEVCKYCIRIKDELPSADEILEYKLKFREEMIEFARGFTWANVARRTYEIYKSLL